MTKKYLMVALCATLAGCATLPEKKQQIQESTEIKQIALDSRDILSIQKKMQSIALQTPRTPQTDKFTLAEQHLHGSSTGIVKNVNLALNLYSQAANAGDTKAMYRLFDIYQNGIIVEPHPQTALKWLKRAAKYQHPQAQFKLGQAYQMGSYTERNLSRASCLYQAAAKQHHHEAEYALGYMYFKSNGVTQNKALAMHYFLQAAQAGHAEAQYQIGLMYYHKETQGIDFDALPKWYQHTLLANTPRRHKNHSAQLAYVWFTMAKVLNNSKASSLQKKLKDTLSDQDISEAHAWIQAWRIQES